ncbi:MAG: hypothetical protein ACOZBH_04490 [Patescibacteria group bacterium]
MKKPQKLTIKQRKLQKLILENLGKEGGSMTMTEMMIKAGYSKSTAHEQSRTLCGIKDKIEPFIEKLESEKEAILDEMIKKRSKARYADLTTAFDKISKHAQLLRGKPTEINEHSISAILDKLEQ